MAGLGQSLVGLRLPQSLVTVGASLTQGGGGPQEPSAPVNSVAPLISGTPTQGQSLAVTYGTWSGYPAPSYATQWKRNGANISGATGMTYLLVSADVGTNITCTVTATNPSGSPSANSNTLGPVAALPVGAPVNSVAPAITGTPTVGQTLTASNGTWSNSPTGYAYQWRRNGVAISGAVNSTYALINVDEGATITVAVTASNSGGSATAVSSGVGPVAAGETPANQTAFSSQMAQPRFLIEMGSPGWLLKSDGTPAVQGDRVDALVASVGGNATAAANGAAAAADANRGLVGATETFGTVSGPVLTMGTSAQTGNRYLSPVGSFGMVSGAMGDIEVLLVRVKPPVSGTSVKTVLGNSSGNFANDINISGATLGGVTVGSDATLIKTDTSERIELYVLNKETAQGNTRAIRINGNETAVSLATGASLTLASGRAVLGNVYGGAQGAEITALLSWAVFPQGTTMANIQRHVGRIIHKFGVQSLVPAQHLFKASAPTVPSGTTSTADWIEANYSLPQQTWKGLMVQVENDAFNGGGSIPPTDPAVQFGVIQSLLPANLRNATTLSDAICAGTEALRLKDTYFTPSGSEGGYNVCRFAMWNQSYRGPRVVDTGSGLTRQVGERWAGQNEQYRWLFERMAGVAVGWWSVPPFYKTTSSQAKGTIWAGGANARTVTLDSIYDETVGSQYDIQMNALVADMFGEVVFVHANIKNVLALFINEAGNTQEENYGTTNWTSRLQISFWKRMIALLRADPRFVNCEVWIDGWHGASTTMRAEPWYANDPLVRDFYHDITDNGNDADNIKANAASRLLSNSAKATALGYLNNWNSDEEEYFYDPAVVAGKGTKWQAANTALKFAQYFEEARSIWNNPMIHIGKHVGYSVANSVSKGEMYSSVVYRRSDAYDQPPATANDPYPAMGYGQWAHIPRNANITRALLKRFRIGATRYPRVSNSALAAGRQVTSAILNGKEVKMVVNRSDTAWPLTVGMKDVATHRVYIHDDENYETLQSTVVANAAAITLQPNQTAFVVQQ